MEGVDIKTAIKDIRGTFVAHLEPNQSKGIFIIKKKIINEYYLI